MMPLRTTIKPSKVSGGVDWITATTTTDRTGAAWLELFWRVVEREQGLRENGYPTARQKRLGYEGVQSEGQFWGRHINQGYMYVAWGEIADGVWHHIAPSARKVSRCDLAVTVELQRPSPQLVARTYGQLKGRPQRQYAIIQTSAGGSTLYVGSRQSGQFGRVYDKGVKDYGLEKGVVWRYEVEIKDKASNYALLKDLIDKWRLNHPMDEEIMGYVHRWFSVRGVSPRFPARGRNLPRVETDVTMTTNDRKLRWLQQQVAPTVQYLIEEGLGDKALLALGLEAEQLPFWSDDILNLSERKG